MSYRVIKSSDEYEAALTDAEHLVAADPTPGSVDADKLELLTVLIEDYEKRQFPFDSPDPIQAIEFRMEEQGLRQKDLIPLLGSRSRVSEVLSGKRPLTVAMIRSLSVGLGIPADILLGGKKTLHSTDQEPAEKFDWSLFPVKEMQKRGWFDFAPSARKKSNADLVKELFDQVTTVPAFALYRRKFLGEGLSEQSRYSILAWTARVLLRAKNDADAAAPFDPDRITPDVLRQLACLSSLDSGPRVAVEFLAKRGITVVIEPALPHTLLDGVALLTERKHAVIGLTLRHDRIDAFWFTLMHEVIHVWKHLSSAQEAFVDRIERTEPEEQREKEANRMARESFIPRGVWRRSKAFLSPTKESIEKLAQDLGISPAIVVGRLHFETGNYRIFNEYLGQGSVRRQFEEHRFLTA